MACGKARDWVAGGSAPSLRDPTQAWAINILELRQGLKLKRVALKFLAKITLGHIILGPCCD